MVTGEKDVAQAYNICNDERNDNDETSTCTSEPLEKIHSYWSSIWQRVDDPETCTMQEYMQQNQVQPKPQRKSEPVATLCFISVPSNRKVRLEALMDGVAVKSAFGRSTCGSPLPLLLEDPKRICQNKGGSVNGTVLLRCQNWLRWRICIGAWCQSHPAQEWYQGQLATQQHGSRRKRDVIRSLDSLASLAEALASLDLSQAFDRIRPCLVLWHAWFIMGYHLGWLRR